MACDRTVAYRHATALGVSELGRPFDAPSNLHGGDRLMLLDIVHSRLPAAELAILPACHTAQMMPGSVADESLRGKKRALGELRTLRKVVLIKDIHFASMDVRLRPVENLVDIGERERSITCEAKMPFTSVAQVGWTYFDILSYDNMAWGPSQAPVDAIDRIFGCPFDFSAQTPTYVGAYTGAGFQEI
ncbi:hypothetical protein EDB89DRAFT_1911476 [Lactarius sanguifluus]|nr:hypothetical protein EDB89DRAFT_1911476 [Lactarius sanguifluus]